MERNKKDEKKAKKLFDKYKIKSPVVFVGM
jgi:hypothetical protein